MRKFKKIVLLLAVSIFCLAIVNCGKSKAEREFDNAMDKAERALDDFNDKYGN